MSIVSVNMLTSSRTATQLASGVESLQAQTVRNNEKLLLTNIEPGLNTTDAKTIQQLQIQTAIISNTEQQDEQELTTLPLAIGKNYMGSTFDAGSAYPLALVDRDLDSGSNFDTTTQSGRFAEGLDVSVWQGTIDWIQVYDANYKFAFTKATEGNCYVDPTYEDNMINGDNAGVYMGAYHFARPDLTGGNTQLQDARNEASCFARWVLPYLEHTSLVPVLDLEISTGYTWAELSAWTEEFMETFRQQTGITPIIYINSSYANNLESYLNVYPLWIANWTFTVNSTPDTGRWSNWKVWQYSNGYTCNGCSDYVTVPGIDGRVDLNIYNGDLNLLEQQILINPSSDFFSTQPIVDTSPKYYTQPVFVE